MEIAQLVCLHGTKGAYKNTASIYKILNFTSNIAALLYFVFFGNIAWLVGFIMIAGQVLGALLGSKMLWKKGAKLIRPVVVIVCFLMAFRIIWQNL